MLNFDMMDDTSPPPTRKYFCPRFNYRIIWPGFSIIILFALCAGLYMLEKMIWHHETNVKDGVKEDKVLCQTPHGFNESFVMPMQNVTLRLGTNFTVTCKILNYGIDPNQKATWTHPLIGTINAGTASYERVIRNRTAKVTSGIEYTNEEMKCMPGSLVESMPVPVRVLNFWLEFTVGAADEGWWTCRSFVLKLADIPTVVRRGFPNVNTTTTTTGRRLIGRIPQKGDGSFYLSVE